MPQSVSASSEQRSSVSVPESIAKQAVAWLVEWQMAEDQDRIWQQIEDWRSADPLHEKAWQHIESINQKLGMVAGPSNSNLAHRVLTKPSVSRRDAVKYLSIFMLMAGGGWQIARNPHWYADHRTSVGQQKTINLPDGTLLVLNSSSAVNIEFTAHERRIVLLKGEAFISTGKASELPMKIQVSQGDLRPIGTEFSVHQLGERAKLSVYDGQVEVQPHSMTGLRIVDAGESVLFSSIQVFSKTSANRTELAWTKGMIVASNMRLDEFLAQLGRHRYGLIQCDPHAANIKVSGTYMISQVDQVLAALEKALPVKVNFYTSFWVQVNAAV
ncbi:FecR domain-containing protein [Litoribrevibacter euphylliae]|uniref:FecR domain-containing protein n=1 Tax=Litoribrevibacter euphylliae TaxID=1834034 RepID=A0ABV7HEP4_9GAMM